MEYQIPQFIEVEDKIFGPFTFKQFIYIGGGAGMCVLLFLKLPLVIAILVGLPVVALAGALAFYKVNNKSFLSIIEAASNHYFSSHLYLWRHENKEEAPKKVEKVDITVEPAARDTLPFRGMTRGRLRELAQSLDVPGEGVGGSE